MNGFSLLFVLATLGVTAGTEVTSTGQSVYVIKIESILVDELRSGKEIETNVALKDRQLRRFRILVSPETPARNTGFQRPENTNRPESLVEYQAVSYEGGEVEMWVQISPERIETLASGRPIEGEVPAEFLEIQRFRIFVGVNQLPRQQSPNATTDTQPRYLSTSDRGVAPASNEILTMSDQNTRASSPFRSATGSTNSRGGVTAPSSSSSPGIRTSAWRNEQDRSTVSPPPFDRYSAQQTAPQSFAGDRGFNAAPSGRFDNNEYTQPAFADRPSGYQFGNTNLNQSQQNYSQVQGYANQGFGTGPAYLQQPQATLAARPENPPLQAPANAAWNQQAAANQPLNTGAVQTQSVAPQVAATPATTTAAPNRATDYPPRQSTSTPLILTTLALFTSLGVNAYLGWLAWSFFWRYRDAVNDTARARSYNSPSRQAA